MPSGIFIEVTTVVPLATVGTETDTAFPAVTERVFALAVRETFVVGVLLVATATYVFALRVTVPAVAEGAALADAPADGLAEALGVAELLGLGEALAVGDGVALDDGLGLGDGETSGVGAPPPPPKKPPGAWPAEIAKVLSLVAAANLVVADALALIVQLPAVNVTVPDETEQLPVAVNVTGVPEEDVAEIATVPDPVCGEIVGKLMV